MKKKTVKNIKKMKSSDKMSVVLESLNDNIAIIAEQHLEITGHLSSIDNRLDGIDNRLDGIDNRLDGIDERLDNMQEDLNVMKDDISDIKYDLKQKVSYDEFEKMEKRVLKLEKLVSAKF
ncbi:MAG TPA: hypothetical protein DDY52_04945 [Candidatus Moranbacteria bacterium]|nr:MAG: hypothetical protein UR51_C0009G0052 [Candidatus Moranbacteria bacterium GW2011_GWF1_34_10]HBI17457.1 hypothetical protein [Candidatus Moranbacteria bacterium]